MFVFAVCAVLPGGKLDRTAVVSFSLRKSLSDIGGNLVMFTSV